MVKINLILSVQLKINQLPLNRCIVNRVSFLICRQFVTFRCWAELRVSHRTYRDVVSSLISTQRFLPIMDWPLWPPAWDYYRRSFQGLVLHRLHQTRHGPEPCNNKKERSKHNWKFFVKKKKRGLLKYLIWCNTSAEWCFCVELP